MTPPDRSPKDLRAYSVALAIEVGEPAAQVFHRIWYFCTRTDSGRVVDGRRWIVNSLPQWREHFPHWRALGTIKTAFRILTEKGLILKANHNLSKQERRLWYTVNFDHPLLAKAGYFEDKASVKNRPMKGQKLTDEGSKIDLCKVKNGPMHRAKNGRSYKHRDKHRNLHRDQSSSLPVDDDPLQISPPKKARGKSNGKGWGKLGLADSGNGEKVSPIPPPDPSDETLRKIYGRVPTARDFLAAEPGKKINLVHYLRPFQTLDEMKKLFSKEEIRAMDTPGPEALETRCANFVERVLQAHFNGEPGEGFRVMVLRAVRGGFLNRCGFRDFCKRGLPKEYMEADPWAFVEHVQETLED